MRASLRTKSELSSHQMARKLRGGSFTPHKTSALSSHQMPVQSSPGRGERLIGMFIYRVVQGSWELRFTIPAGWTSPSLAVKVREDFSLRDGDSLLDVFVVLLSLEEPSSYRRIFLVLVVLDVLLWAYRRYGRIYVI